MRGWRGACAPRRRVSCDGDLRLVRALACIATMKRTLSELNHHVSPEEHVSIFDVHPHQRPKVLAGLAVKVGTEWLKEKAARREADDFSDIDCESVVTSDVLRVMLDGDAIRIKPNELCFEALTHVHTRVLEYVVVRDCDYNALLKHRIDTCTPASKVQRIETIDTGRGGKARFVVEA